jgi:hypothetical protein
LTEPAWSRRDFLSGIKSAALVALTAGGVSLTPWQEDTVEGAEAVPCSSIAQIAAKRADLAYALRERLAMRQRLVPMPGFPCNGDEQLFPDAIASFTKTLPHNDLGEVRLDAYAKLLDALKSANPDAFEAIPQRGTIKLVNPQAAFAYELEGPDSHHMSMPAAPSFLVPESASEMVELYWQALARDVSFADYKSNQLIQQAASDLSRMTTFQGPKEKKRVTSRTLFRGDTPGDLTGPYISQFLVKPVQYGAAPMEQRIQTAVSGDDFATDYKSWLNLQQGSYSGKNQLDSTPRYIRNGRDLTVYVHQDMAYHPYVSAAFILMAMNAPLNAGNPYVHSKTQVGFATFGYPHIFYLFGSVCNRALKCAWFQKWLVDRRLRPEAFGGRIHNHLTGNKGYLIYNDVLYSEAVQETSRRFGTFLLPQAYPEGAPAHPSYPSGHATMAGACITVLKAFFDEYFVIPNPVVSNADGTVLLNYDGQNLTVGGELNKLGANIALGRDFAGIHYRTDGIEGMKLGESVAISVLAELKSTYNEKFNGFTFTKLDGTKITV